MEKKDCCYEEMSKGTKVLEQSEAPMDDVPYENEFEMKRPGSDGLNQSGFGSNG